MSDRRNFLKNLFGITAGSFIAAKAGSEIWQGRDEFKSQYDKSEMINASYCLGFKEKAATYPRGMPTTTFMNIISSAWAN